MPRDADENPHDPDQPPAVRIYRETGIDSVTTSPFAGGIVSVVSTACPGKTTPNEDSAGLVDCGPRSGVLLVADGVGGHRSGAFASRSVVRIVAEHLHALRDSDGISSSRIPRGMIRAAILDGLDEANQTLLDSGLGCATTLAAVEINGREIRPFHVGDSEILVVGQRGKIKLHTVCHSPVGFAVEAGLLDESEAIHHEDRHIVSNVVGTTDMRVEMGTPLKLAANDTLLIASDGLFDNLRLDEIIESIRKGPLDAAVRRLIALARERMEAVTEGVPSKPDDLTVIAFRSPLPRRRRRQRKPSPATAAQPQQPLPVPAATVPAPESAVPVAPLTTAADAGRPVTAPLPGNGIATRPADRNAALASAAAEPTAAEPATAEPATAEPSVSDGPAVDGTAETDAPCDAEHMAGPLPATAIPETPRESESPEPPAATDEQSGDEQSPPAPDRSAATSTATDGSSDEPVTVPPPAHASWWPFRLVRK